MMHLTLRWSLLPIFVFMTLLVRDSGHSLLASPNTARATQAMIDSGAESPCILIPVVQKIRVAAARTQSINNLKQIGLAMHSYHDVNKSFPAAAICDKKGKPLLSWRVAILPYIEQLALYELFRLEEPWDSENNRQLIPRMPNVYVVPAAPQKFGETYYQVFVGNGGGFEVSTGVKILEITDGTSNTIMCIEASASVPWTKPEDLVYDAKKPLPRLADFYGSRVFPAVFFDGSVHTLRTNIGETNMRALITRAGGEIIELDF